MARTDSTRTEAQHHTEGGQGRPWFRMHYAGRLLSDLRSQGRQFRISVLLLPEAREVASDCCTENLELAKHRADRMVRESFPHTCDKEECGPWVQYSR